MFLVARSSATSHWRLSPQHDSSVMSRLGWEALGTEEHCPRGKQCGALSVRQRLTVSVAAERGPLDHLGEAVGEVEEQCHARLSAADLVRPLQLRLLADEAHVP